MAGKVIIMARRLCALSALIRLFVRGSNRGELAAVDSEPVASNRLSAWLNLHQIHHGAVSITKNPRVQVNSLPLMALTPDSWAGRMPKDCWL